MVTAKRRDYTSGGRKQAERESIGRRKFTGKELEVKQPSDEKEAEVAREWNT